MKGKLSIIILLLLVASSLSNAQLLFRISGVGLEKSSYLLGSLHVVSGEALQRYDAFLDAEKECQQLYVEYDVTDEQHVKEMQDTGLKIANLPDSITIFDVLGEEKSKILREVMQKSTHVNLNDPSTMSLWHWQPFMFTNVINIATATEMLKQVPTLRKLQGKGVSMDVTCILRGKLHGWKIGELDKLAKQEELEKTKEKLAQSIDVQVDSLVVLLNGYEERRQAQLKGYTRMDKLALSWIKGDFDEFTGFMGKETDNAPAIISERNKKWLPQIIDAMKEAPTMFVVGAGHLIRPYGIVNLLREAGYKVEQVKTFKW